MIEKSRGLPTVESINTDGDIRFNTHRATGGVFPLDASFKPLDYGEYIKTMHRELNESCFASLLFQPRAVIPLPRNSMI